MGDTQSGREVHRAAMRPRLHRQNLVMWNSSTGPAGGYGAPRNTRLGRTRRIRRWIRTAALFAVIGLVGLARAVRSRRGATLVLAGAGFTAAGSILPNGVVLIFGMLVLLRGVAVALGVSEPHRGPHGAAVRGADVFGFGTRVSEPRPGGHGPRPRR
jgi:hypothetical protein